MSNLSEAEKELISQLAKEFTKRQLAGLLRTDDPPLIFKHGPEGMAQKAQLDRLEKLLDEYHSFISKPKVAYVDPKEASDFWRNRTPEHKDENILYLKFDPGDELETENKHGFWAIDPDHPGQREALRHFHGGPCVNMIGYHDLEQLAYVAGIHGWRVETEGDPAREAVTEELGDKAPDYEKPLAKISEAQRKAFLDGEWDDKEQMPVDPTFMFLPTSGHYYLVHKGRTWRHHQGGFVPADGYFKDALALRRAWRHRLSAQEQAKFGHLPE